MKTWKLDVNGKAYVVQIDHLNASPISVTVNGKTFQVTVAEENTVSVKPMVVSSAVEDEEYEAFVPDVASTFIAPTADVHEEATPNSPLSTSAEGAKVIAPMPGKILDIVTKVGDVVKVGDTLCNLEAMKMKSPIRSTAAGKIMRIAVSEGQSVNYGDVLFVLG